MTVGLPGSGIGGIFYIFTALWAPFGELFGIVRRGRRPGRLRLALSQGFIALCILASLWLTGELIVRAWYAVQLWGLGASAGTGALAGAPEIFRTGAIALSFITLGLVLLSVPVLRVVARVLPARPAESEATAPTVTTVVPVQPVQPAAPVGLAP